MNVYLVYDDKGELQEAHALEPVAEVRAGHFGGTYEARAVEPLPAYTSEDLQAVIDDLDTMKAYVPNRFVKSLKVASAILVMFPEEALRAQDEYVSG